MIRTQSLPAFLETVRTQAQEKLGYTPEDLKGEEVLAVLQEAETMGMWVPWNVIPESYLEVTL